MSIKPRCQDKEKSAEKNLLLLKISNLRNHKRIFVGGGYNKLSNSDAINK